MGCTFQLCYCPMSLLLYTVKFFKRVVYHFSSLAPIFLPIFSSTYFSKAFTTTRSPFKCHQWTVHCQIQPWIFTSYLTWATYSIYTLSFLKYFLALFLGTPQILSLLSISSDCFSGFHPPCSPRISLWTSPIPTITQYQDFIYTCWCSSNSVSQGSTYILKSDLLNILMVLDLASQTPNHTPNILLLPE